MSFPHISHHLDNHYFACFHNFQLNHMSIQSIPYIIWTAFFQFSTSIAFIDPGWWGDNFLHFCHLFAALTWEWMWPRRVINMVWATWWALNRQKHSCSICEHTFYRSSIILSLFSKTLNATMLIQPCQPGLGKGRDIQGLSGTFWKCINVL